MGILSIASVFAAAENDVRGVIDGVVGLNAHFGECVYVKGAAISQNRGIIMQIPLLLSGRFWSAQQKNLGDPLKG